MTEIIPIKDSTLTQRTTADNPPMYTYWTANKLNWAVDFPKVIPFYEDSVFQCELEHTSTDYTMDIPWKIRIGKGGQMYSVTVSGRELMPPGNQYPWLSAIGFWNDDCMTTTHWSSAHKTDEGILGNGYIHGSGMYVNLKEPKNNHAFWCPLLSEKFDPVDKSYSVLNIGVAPEPSVNRADILFYSKYRDVGAGAIEVTFFYYNYGNYTYTWSESPWTAVRGTILPDYAKSKSDNTYELFPYGPVGSGFFNLRDPLYGGWMAKTANIKDPKSLTFSVVNGTDKYFAAQSALSSSDPMKWENTTTGNLGINMMVGTAPNIPRDFSLISTILAEYLRPGQHIFSRSFVVLGELENVAKISQSLSPFVETGRVNISVKKASKLHLYETTLSGSNIITASKPTPTSIPVASSLSTPTSGSFPLFLMKNNTTGLYAISTDHYLFSGKLPFTNTLPLSNARYAEFQNRHVYQIYDGNTQWLELLGFALPLDNSQLSNGFVKVSDAFTNVTFEAGEKLNANQLMIWSALS